MSKLTFDDAEVIKKEFYESKKAVSLSEVSVDKIVISNNIKRDNETSKVFISCLVDISGIVSPLYIILPQMSCWIKYFENGGKNMSFQIEDDKVYSKYNET